MMDVPDPEFLAEHETKPKVLFATHYHELQELAEKFPVSIANYQVAVERHQGKPLFLYTVIPGKSSHSFGVAVAELAGVPKSVITKAEEHLAELEAKHNTEHRKPLSKQKEMQTISHPVVNQIKNLDISSMTPIFALNILLEYQKQLNDDKN